MYNQYSIFSSLPGNRIYVHLRNCHNIELNLCFIVVFSTYKAHLWHPKSHVFYACKVTDYTDITSVYMHCYHIDLSTMFLCFQS